MPYLAIESVSLTSSVVNAHPAMFADMVITSNNDNAFRGLSEYGILLE